MMTCPSPGCPTPLQPTPDAPPPNTPADRRRRGITTHLVMVHDWPASRAMAAAEEAVPGD